MKKHESKISNQVDYNKLVAEFAEKERKLEEKLWIDSNLTKLDDVLRLNYHKSVNEFATIVLRHLAELSNAFSGTFFFYNKNNEMIEAIAGYAHKVSKLKHQSYQVGEGVVGQAVASKKSLFFDDIPSKNIETSLSVVTIEISNILVFPLIFNEQVHGVIELVYISELPKKFLTLFENFGRNIAVMLESTSKNEVNQTLLKESQEQTEKLRTQEEELRQNLEELSATQEVLEKQKIELEEKDRKMQVLMQEMKINEEDMQQNEQRMRKVIKDFQLQKREAKEKDKLIEKLQAELEKLKIKS